MVICNIIVKTNVEIRDICLKLFVCDNAAYTYVRAFDHAFTWHVLTVRLAYELHLTLISRHVGRKLQHCVLSSVDYTAWLYSLTIQLDYTAGLYSWIIQLDSTAGPYSWTIQLHYIAGLYSWYILLDCAGGYTDGLNIWSIQLDCAAWLNRWTV